MDRSTRPGVDIWGWLGLVLAVGVMWFTMMFTAIKEYFMSNGIELAKLVFALLMTVIVWLAHVLRQSRSWEDYGDEIRQWQAQHDVDYAEQIFKVTFGKAMEIYNIAAGRGDDEDEEVIGG